MNFSHCDSVRLWIIITAKFFFIVQILSVFAISLRLWLFYNILTRLDLSPEDVASSKLFNLFRALTSQLRCPEKGKTENRKIYKYTYNVVLVLGYLFTFNYWLNTNTDIYVLLVGYFLLCYDCSVNKKYLLTKYTFYFHIIKIFSNIQETVKNQNIILTYKMLNIFTDNFSKLNNKISN